MTLREQTQQREAQTLSPMACLSRNTRGRQRPEEECPIRTPFQRDIDRIVYCNAFRRLKHKTQVFLQPEGDHYRTRMTHTLEVTRIARTIARGLSLNEDLTEAIALFEQVLTDSIRVLGDDHPDTLTSRNNLAGAYYAAGRLTEAITLYEQVTKDCARILGEDHPLTKTVRENLKAAQHKLAQQKGESSTEESAAQD